jgi:tetratricopeptide (TPR) repeat protein
MITLYDVLGAHPDDDAEGLRNAFRNAVKNSHPDLREGDPAAAARFRHIVRAKAILSDPDQRAIYDHLLEFERWKLRPRTRRRIALDALRNLASDAIAVVVVAAVLAGGYLMFVHLSKASVAAGEAMQLVARGDAGLGSPPTQPQGIKLSREELHALLTGPEPVPAAASPPAGATDAVSVRAPVVQNEPIAADAPAPVASEAAAPEDVARGEEATPPSAAAVAAKNADDDQAPQNGDAGPAIAVRSEPEIQDPEIVDSKVSDAKTSEAAINEAKINKVEINETKLGEAEIKQTSEAAINETKLGGAEIKQTNEAAINDAKINKAEINETKLGEAEIKQTSEARISDAKVSDVTDGAKPDDPTVSQPAIGNADTTGAKSGDSEFYRERGMAFYRNGDLDRALADFDAAIELDPRSASAYIDRSLVLYRKAEPERAFADIAHANRIDNSLKAAATTHRAPPAPPRN